MTLSLSADEVITICQICDGDETKIRALFDLLASRPGAPVQPESPYIGAWAPTTGFEIRNYSGSLHIGEPPGEINFAKRRL